jgi:uncharacterized protein with von Willebrand factor type A (vWA) domain
LESAFVPNVLLFGRLLRRAGVEVHHNRLLEAVRALDIVGVGRRDDVRATLASLLVHRREDLAPFHEAFDLFFRARRQPTSGLPLFSLGERPRVVARPVAGTPIQFEMDGGSASPAQASTLAVGAYSPVGVSRTKDFADFSAAELEHARRLLVRLPWRLGHRATRRWQPASRGAIDLRAVLRQSAARGELIDLPHRRRRLAPRPVVVLADVSGSMERYSRVLLHFAYGLTRGARHAESFVFATRLTRITRSVMDRGGRSALTRVIRRVHDWGGGTQIGAALRTFNTKWARRVMRNGPVVLIVSDGWDRGDPEALASELARIHRTARRVLWLNPLLGSARYEPLTRGMTAALGHVDAFLPAHNLESLEQLARRLAGSRTDSRGWSGPRRRSRRAE